MAGSSDILILTGASGSGKTSVARCLARSWPKSVHLESDRFFGFIEGGYIEPWRSESDEQNRAVMGIVAGAAVGYAQAGYATIVDGIVLPASFFEPLRDALQREGFRVSYAALRPSLLVVQQRARTRHTGSLSDSAVIETIWAWFADLGDLESHAIDTTNQTTNETARTLEDRLRRGDLVV